MSSATFNSWNDKAGGDLSGIQDWQCDRSPGSFSDTQTPMLGS